MHEHTSVAAIVASYRPTDDLVGTARALVAQFDHVVVVDDGSPVEYAGTLDAIEREGAVVLRRPRNAGIAAVLNAGVAEANRRWEVDFYLTLDQDSLPVEDYAERAVGAFLDARATGLRVGFVSAASYSGNPVPTLSGRDPSGRFDRPFDPMQSGFVIPRATFDRVGPFDEGFVIDGVDSEFTARVRQHGLEIIVGPGCRIEHQLGSRDLARWFGRAVRFGGRQIAFNYHSPTRVYYICRNGTTITLRYALRQPAWVLRRLVEEAKAHLMRALFSPHRLQLAIAASAGFRDALRRRSGPVPAALAQRIAKTP
jgi:rhamnosyltransferase